MTRGLDELAHFVADLQIEDVPARVIDRAKLHVLDALTTAVAALRIPAGRIVAHAYEPLDAGGAAHIVATGRRASVQAAAFANTQMSVALDLGANLYFSQGLGGLTVFGPLACAEAAGTPAAELLLAVICGWEVAGRIGLSFPPALRFDAGKAMEVPRHGTRWVALGAAAATAKIRSLTPEQTAHALALAAAGVPVRPSPRRSADHLPMVKYGLLGEMSTTAINAVLLAEHGFTGDLQIFTETDGFNQALESELADPGALTRGLGDWWCILDGMFKRYPSGTFNQPSIHIVEQLIARHGIAPGSIREIRIGRAIATAGMFANVAPTNEMASQFSLPFGVAAVAWGIAPRSWHTALADERVRSLALRVELAANDQAMHEVVAASDTERRSPSLLRSHVQIRTASGLIESWSSYGDVSADEIGDKFRHYCEDTLDEAKATNVIRTVSNLENVRDLQQLIDPFARQVELRPL